MCEFKVYVGGVQVTEDVVYALAEGDKVIIRDILGEQRIFEGVEIMEVNVLSTRLMLARASDK